MGTLEKYPDEDILYTMNFDGVGRIGDGDSIATVVSVISDLGTITPTSFSTDNKENIQFRIAGGVQHDNHQLSAEVTTLGGDTLIGRGFLRII